MMMCIIITCNDAVIDNDIREGFSIFHMVIVKEDISW